MSEPVARAGEIEELFPGLWHYSVHDERIDTESDAFALVESGRVILIDPLPVIDGLLEPLGRVEAILLGAPSHQRSAWRLRRETGAKVHAPLESEGLEEPADAAYHEDDRLPGGLRAIHAPGPKGPHHVFYLATGPGVLFLTDLMLNRPGTGPDFLKDEFFLDPALARHSARRLLEYRFDALCFGHGRPILKGGRPAYEDRLRREAGGEG